MKNNSSDLRLTVFEEIIKGSRQRRSSNFLILKGNLNLLSEDDFKQDISKSSFFYTYVSTPIIMSVFHGSLIFTTQWIGECSISDIGHMW